jgi:hypothetical protein
MVKEKDTNSKSPLSEYQRYIRGEMTKREENSFLKKFQGDPFADKATTGFSGISLREEVDDKDTPGKQLKKWTDSRKRMTFISSVVLIALIIIISSLFIVLDKNKTARQPINDNVKPYPQEVTDSNHITGLIQGETNNSETSNNKIDIAIPTRTYNTGITENTKAPAMTAAKDSTLSAEKDRISTTARDSGTHEISSLNGRGKIVSSENNPPVADLPAAAPKKIVSTEFGMSIKTDNKQPGYINPQPVDGISNFNKYIEENMIKSLAQTPAEDSVVVVSFMVLTTGSIDSIKVINSRVDEFAREVIGLIRKGPAWKPAENNGKTIDDEVRVRIISK